MTSHRIPFRVKPMLATLVAEPFHQRGFIYEEKYDGFRIIAYKEGKRVSLITRNLKDRTDEFPEIAAAVGALPAPTLALDGEIVIFDRAGVSRFQLMQRRLEGEAEAAPVFAVFDALWARGSDLRARPLAERRRVVEREVREGESLIVARRLAADGFEAFEAARRRGLEGLIAKDETSRYLAGVRSPAWRKVKVRAEEEFVIGGFTAPAGSRTHFGAGLPGPARGQARVPGALAPHRVAAVDGADLVGQLSPSASLSGPPAAPRTLASSPPWPRRG